MFLKTRLLLGSVMMSYTPSGGKATEKRAWISQNVPFGCSTFSTGGSCTKLSEGSQASSWMAVLPSPSTPSRAVEAEEAAAAASWPSFRSAIAPFAVEDFAAASVRGVYMHLRGSPWIWMDEKNPSVPLNLDEKSMFPLNWMKNMSSWIWMKLNHLFFWVHTQFQLQCNSSASLLKAPQIMY